MNKKFLISLKVEVKDVIHWRDRDYMRTFAEKNFRKNDRKFTSNTSVQINVLLSLLRLQS